MTNDLIELGNPQLLLFDWPHFRSVYSHNNRSRDTSDNRKLLPFTDVSLATQIQVEQFCVFSHDQN